LDDEYDEGEVFDEMMMSGRGEIRHCLSYLISDDNMEDRNSSKGSEAPPPAICPSSS
jgi:hypothetical protein